MFKRNKKNLDDFDWTLFFIVLVLCAFGLVILYSATLSLNNNRHIITQIVATALGFLAIFILSVMDFDLIRKVSLYFYILGNALLVFTLMRGVGGKEWGADAWLRFGSFGFQPSEFMKVFLILYLAQYLDSVKERINEPKVLLKSLVISFIPVALIGLQPDFGTAMVFVFFIILMHYTAGVRIRYFFYALGLGLLSLPLAWFVFSDYQKNRIRVLLNPESDVTGIAWQFNQGALAVGSGKFTGRGLFKGAQTQYDFISLKENDYIFAVLGEELGFVGAFFLIVLYTLLLWRLLSTAKRDDSVFGRTMIVGFAAMILIHVFENIGMIIGVMPITGIPLPYMSYGGTFQVINLVVIGLVFSYTTQRKMHHSILEF